MREDANSLTIAISCQGTDTSQMSGGPLNLEAGDWPTVTKSRSTEANTPFLCGLTGVY